MIISRNMDRYKYTDEDIEFLKIHYPIGDWEAIYQRFPEHTRLRISGFCNKRNIRSEYKRRNLSGNLNSSKWTKEEDEILRSNYENSPMDKVQKLLPQRTYNSIVSRAKRHNLISYNRKKELYKHEEIQYIIDNWKDKSDHLIAEELGRTFRSVKFMREKLGLYRQDPNRTLSYVNLERFLRGNIYQWKARSMERCNYQCVLTGSKDFAIHHLINFTTIVRNFAEENNIDFDKPIDQYSKDELDSIVFYFNEYHDTFPLGVCVSKDLHKLFHHLYGKTYNTSEQWEEFMEDYKRGKYNH